MWFNKNTNASYGFVAPDVDAHADAKKEVLFPYPVSLTPTPVAGAVEIEIKTPKTFVDIGELDADCVVSADVDEAITAGALLTVKAKSDNSARDVSFSTGFCGGGITGIAGKTWVQTFVFDGTNFTPVSDPVLVDGVIIPTPVPDIVTVVPDSGAADIEVSSHITVADLGELDAACAVSATISAGVLAGALLIVKAKSDTTARDVSFTATGFEGGAIAGTISKTKVQTFIFNGTKFMPVAAAVQID